MKVLFDFYKYLEELILNAKTENNYIKIKKEGYDNLSFEILDGNSYIISHTRIQNGDLMEEPSIRFNITKDKKIKITEYTQHSLGIYEEVNDKMNIEKKKDIYEFFKTWLINLKHQGFISIKEEFKNEDTFEAYIEIEEINIKNTLKNELSKKHIIVDEELLNTLGPEQSHNLLSLIENKKRDNLIEHITNINGIKIEIKERETEGIDDNGEKTTNKIYMIREEKECKGKLLI